MPKVESNSISSDSPINNQQEYSLETISKHNETSNCWLVIEGQVYDVTSFLDLHPGGDSVIMDYGGKDCTEEFYQTVHQHSESAVSLLKKYHIGSVKGLKKKKKNNVSPNNVINSEGKSSKELVDFNFAVLPQILKMHGEYQDWVHKTATTKMRIFEWDFFENLSYHPWWYIFFMWIPVISYLFYSSIQEGNTILFSSILFLIGMFIWTFLEYLIHRFIFHMDSNSPVGNFFHFFLHGAHHLTPMEPNRLTFPPTFAPPVGLGIYTLVHWIIPSSCMVKALFSGGAFMYMLYDTMHFFFHHGDISGFPYLKEMKRRHMSHHFKDDLKNFGVTSPLWDIVFGTNGPEWTLFDKDPLEKSIK